MTGVNLLPWREKILRRRKGFWLSGITLMLLTVTVISAGIRQYLQGCRIRSDLWGSQQEAVIQQTVQLLAQQQQLNQRLLESQRQNSNRRRQQKTFMHWRTFLSQLPVLMPDSVWLHSLSQQQGSLLLRGQTDTLASLFIFSRCLRALPFFTRIDIQELGPVSAGGYGFSLTAVLSEMMQFSEEYEDE